MERFQSLTSKAVLASAFALSALALGSPLAGADTNPYLATYYNFNLSLPSGGVTIGSTSLPISAVASNGTSPGNGSLTGSTLLSYAFGNTGNLNKLSTDTVTNTNKNLNDIGYRIGATTNGQFFTLQFDRTNFADTIVSFALRNTSAGATSETVSVSSDGISFADVQTQTTFTDSNYHIYSTYVNAAQFNTTASSTEYLRVTLNGATDTGNAASARFSYIQVTPAPSSLLVALVGVPGIGLLVRRRKVAK